MAWLLNNENITRGSSYEYGLILSVRPALSKIAGKNDITTGQLEFLLTAYIIEGKGQTLWPASQVGKQLNYTTARSHQVVSILIERDLVVRADSGVKNKLTGPGKLIVKEFFRTVRRNAKEFSGS